MVNKKYDWCIHGVACENAEDQLRGMMDFHTHGLEKYLGAELQFVLGYDIVEAGSILNHVGTLLKDGPYFVADGLVIKDYFSDHASLRINLSKDCFGKKIWRIIVPDSKLRWPEESDEEPYCWQMMDCAPYRRNSGEDQ